MQCVFSSERWPAELNQCSKKHEQGYYDALKWEIDKERIENEPDLIMQGELNANNSEFHAKAQSTSFHSKNLLRIILSISCYFRMRMKTVIPKRLYSLQCINLWVEFFLRQPSQWCYTVFPINLFQIVYSAWPSPYSFCSQLGNFHIILFHISFFSRSIANLCKCFLLRLKFVWVSFFFRLWSVFVRIHKQQFLKTYD